MPTHDSDHHLSTAGRRRQSSLSSPFGVALHDHQDNQHSPPRSDPDASISPLPAYAYSKPQGKRHVVATAVLEPSPTTGVNGFPLNFAPADTYPDPHDFYRLYPDPFTGPAVGGLVQSDLVVAQREDSMTATRQQSRTSPLAVRISNTKLPPPSRIHTTHGTRKPLPSSTDISPVPTKSPSSPATPARNRQSSLKDLVHRFNQTPDEVPPLPRKSPSRSTSTSSHPAVSTSHARAHLPYQSKGVGNGSARKGDVQPPRKAPETKQRSWNSNHNNDMRPKSAKSTATSNSVRPDPNALASQSMVDLSLNNLPATQRPLFGEVTSNAMGQSGLGYGILGPRRRRGSEGSMHSPNPMFPDEHSSRRDSSPSPSAWYLGVTPTLEQIRMEKTIPALRPQMHRRTRSDFTTVPIRRRPPEMPVVITDGVSPPPTTPLSPKSPRTYKPDSQSRIPISSKRLSFNSDSSNSNLSTQPPATLERHPGPIGPPKGGSSLPKNGNKNRSPVHTPRPSSSRNSQRHGDHSPGQGLATSPRLPAYISAPLPKKSPPLRSSRPRQPVSSASTSASRARAVERLSRQQSGSAKSTKDARAKKPPELGGVDFAARRQKIQQAFTRTVRENERQEIEAEKRRRPMVPDVQSGVSETVDDLGPPTTEERSCEQDAPAMSVESHVGPGGEDFQTPAEELPKEERELRISTGHLSERSVLDLSQEDSPTLGGFNRFSNLSRIDKNAVTPPSDVEPHSALTADTSDSADTYFDNEPQEDTAESLEGDPSPFNDIINPEDASLISSSSACLAATDAAAAAAAAALAEESPSEKDDRESIQIMFSETPVLEKTLYNETLKEGHQGRHSNEVSDGRWSTSSWTSSIRSRDRNSSADHERNSQTERGVEQLSSKPENPAHLSMSTASTNATPQPWSPATFPSPLTNRTTMESDTYSTVNRFLDHYHDSGILSPHMMNDIQQHILPQSPELARQGGWDSKKVTQIVLQGRYAQINAATSPLKVQSGKPVVPDHPTSSPKDHAKDVENEGKSLSARANQDVETASPREIAHATATLEVEDDGPRPHRASLNVPADWAMSPSISDWIHLQAVDSPLDEKPLIPPKDWNMPELEGSKRGLVDEPYLSAGTSAFRPELPEIKGTGEGLGIGGLAINVTEPQEDESPTILPPPLPDHLPPPPPVEPADEEASVLGHVKSPPSPSIYSKHDSLGSHSKATFVGDTDSLNPSVNDPPRRPSIPTTSIQPPTSSSASNNLTPTESIDASSTVPRPTSPEQKRLIKRRHIIKELVETEYTFGQDMKVVEDIYRGTSNVIISLEDVKTLFGNSDQIVLFSTNFLDALKQAAKGIYMMPKSKRWRSNRASNATSYSGTTDDQSSVSGGELSDEEKDRKTFVGEMFNIHLADMEKVYGDYLKNHEAANQRLLFLQKNQKVQVWLKECRLYAHDLTSAWNLDSLLVKPVQRLTRYPLLLDQLLEATPENHPDYNSLVTAAREIKGISARINDLKKRADLMEQVAGPRKRKESDVRLGLSKAFGRRTEKLKQQVGLSELIEDKAYTAVSERFGSHFFQLQVVMRDVEMYSNDVQIFMNRFNEFVLAIEAYMDVGQTSHPEVESKWRKFRLTTREMSRIALTDHVNAVRKNVIEPMTTLLKLHEGPQKLMQKRNKRIPDYARFKAAKDRGEKPDKKLVEQGEQYMAINDTLKEELPRLFSLTGKLVEACLNSFVQLQLQWHIIWRRKLSEAIDDYKVPSQISEIVEAFSGDFAFSEAQVLSLGICNGSMLADTVNLVNFLSPTSTVNGDGNNSPRQASLELNKRRTLSISSEKSPMLPQPDFGSRNLSGEGGLHLSSGAYSTPNQPDATRRMRASSAVSSQSPRTPDVPGSYRTYFNSINSTPSSNPTRPKTAINRTITEPSPIVIHSDFEAPDRILPGEDPNLIARPYSGSTYPQVGLDLQQRSSSPSGRYSGFFSSAMPMSDSPPAQSPLEAPGRTANVPVIFLAASVYEFNIDRARKEAGYPYLTYVAGEIFDVIGEKGELWLAKNQDDSTHLVGWIWCKHFVKLAA